jgi:hypothetical protein
MSITNHTQPDLGMIPGCCGEKPVTNCMSYGMAKKACKSSYKVMLNTPSLYENQNSLTIFFVKFSNIKFHENPSYGSQVVSCIQTGEKLIRHSVGL